MCRPTLPDHLIRVCKADSSIGGSLRSLAALRFYDLGFTPTSSGTLFPQGHAEKLISSGEFLRLPTPTYLPPLTPFSRSLPRKSPQILTQFLPQPQSHQRALRGWLPLSQGEVENAGSNAERASPGEYPSWEGVCRGNQDRGGAEPFKAKQTKNNLEPGTLDPCDVGNEFLPSNHGSILGWGQDLWSAVSLP